MKKFILYIFIAAVTTGVYTSCSKSIYGVADTFNVIVNGTKINSPFLSFGGTSLAPVLGTNYGYAAVSAGALTIKLSTNGVLTGDSTALKIYTGTTAPGAFYTFLLTDNGSVGGLIGIKDSMPIILPGYYNLRFINTVAIDSAVTSTGTSTVDIFSYSRNTTLFNKIPASSFTSFSFLGTNNFVADTLYVTRTPSTAQGTPPLSGRVVLAKLALTPIGGRTYTIYYKGDGTLATGTKARSLAYYVNQ